MSRRAGWLNEPLCEHTGLDLKDPVDRAVGAILSDVTDRRGWRQEWDGFDQDVREEIIASWRAHVRAHWKHDPLKAGDVLEGFCGGYFGRDSHDDKQVEAVGRDWVVARYLDGPWEGKPVTYEGPPENLLPYRKT